MSYKDFERDGTPELDLIIGKKYLVNADISTCFPSIYTHSISWALVGKNVAKSNRGNKNVWYNELDFSVRNTSNGETQGILIGPHSSNILSEILLTSIDFELSNKGWKYIRNIDDYTCYVTNYEDGQKLFN
ncbi:RNA-directed DNA polymerase [Paraliobacillus sediminis]|uniref:RNA-directed DNA polymerase n=1 Tax=Paraliobacillus sediminis TaxID=1885916 RepID=UPI001F071816|nr:RNA-directed DNA polymerase [Paraliobacillus sediminis]